VGEEGRHNLVGEVELLEQGQSVVSYFDLFRIHGQNSLPLDINEALRLKILCIGCQILTPIYQINNTRILLLQLEHQTGAKELNAGQLLIKIVLDEHLSKHLLSNRVVDLKRDSFVLYFGNGHDQAFAEPDLLHCFGLLVLESLQDFVCLEAPNL